MTSKEKNFYFLILLFNLLLTSCGNNTSLTVCDPSVQATQPAKELNTDFHKTLALHAPEKTLFQNRGTASFQLSPCLGPSHVLGPSFADFNDPGYGVLKYGDILDEKKSFAIYFTSAGAIWKIDRGLDSQKTEYLGALHYAECPGEGMTTTDRVIQPALGLQGSFGIENGAKLPLVRTNYGCRNSNYSNPYPVENYQGAGSGRGILSSKLNLPYWDSGTQTLLFRSRPYPWVYYPGILDSNNLDFLGDFLYSPDRNLVRTQVQEAIDNVELEVALGVLPDGTIKYAWRWKDLQGRPWTTHATDGIWAALNSYTSGRTLYQAAGTSQKYQAITDLNGIGLSGDLLSHSGGWVAFMTDSVFPELGLVFHFGSQMPSQSGVSLFPGSQATGAPAIGASNIYSGWSRLGSLFRQNFFSFGRMDEVNQKHVLLAPYIKYIDQ